MPAKRARMRTLTEAANVPLRVDKGHPCRQHLAADMDSSVQTLEKAACGYPGALNYDCLYYLWWFLPNHDMVRCERVCKSWQHSIKLWSKSGLQSRFGGYRLSELLGHVDEPEDNGHHAKGDDTGFRIFKDLSHRERAVQEHSPICTLTEKSGAFAPQGEHISLEDLNYASHFSHRPPTLLNLFVNHRGIMLVELEYASDDMYNMDWVGPVRELRVLHLQWPEPDIIDPNEQPDDDIDEEFNEDFDEQRIQQAPVSGTLFHEPFSRLTVVQDKQKEETKFCYLKKAKLRPEVVA
ncbi:hypothetical protein BDV12DRAFT_198872 [Aspergillus spectabilis]